MTRHRPPGTGKASTYEMSTQVDSCPNYKVLPLQLTHSSLYSDWSEAWSQLWAFSYLECTPLFYKEIDFYTSWWHTAHPGRHSVLHKSRASWAPDTSAASSPSKRTRPKYHALRTLLTQAQILGTNHGSHSYYGHAMTEVFRAINQCLG